MRNTKTCYFCLVTRYLANHVVSPNILKGRESGRNSYKDSGIDLKKLVEKLKSKQFFL